jgi:hypothetical protein
VKDPLFSTPPAGPDAASWIGAGFRALHPLRWGLALVGLAATLTVAAMLQSLFDGRSPRLGDWFGQPAEQTQALGAHLAERSTLGLAIRLGTLLAVVAGVWGLVGAWIARHEVLARHRGEPYATPERIDPGPTALVKRQLKNLVVGFPIILVLCAVVSLPVMMAGGVNHLGGFGAILVAVLLPVVLVADLILLLIAVGLVAWPFMPVTIAAENSDSFDALSRAYNYAYLRPLRFVLLTTATMAAAALPTAGVLFALVGPVENWLPALGHPAVWAAAGLSASIYWSLETLVYLHLRMAVDEVDANEIAREPPPQPPAVDTPADADGPTAAAPRAAARTNWLHHLLILGMMVVTWVVTAWLFARLGGEDASWLGWGMGEHFRPPADGLYAVASLIAGVWGAIWIVAPILVAMRRAIRPDAGQTAVGPVDRQTAADQPNRS